MSDERLRERDLGSELWRTQYALDQALARLAQLERYREALQRARKLDWEGMRRLIDGMSLPMDMQPRRERLLREMEAVRQALQEQSGE